MSAQTSKTVYVGVSSVDLQFTTVTPLAGSATRGGEVLVIDFVTGSCLNGATADVFTLTILGDTRTIWASQISVAAAIGDTIHNEWVRGLPCFANSASKVPETSVIVQFSGGSGVANLATLCVGYHFERLSTFG